MFLTSPLLSTPTGIGHGFFTRNGGVSTGMLTSLNCGGRGTADSAENVDENRSRVAKALKVKPKNLLSLYQIHSNAVVTVHEPWSVDARPEADAMVTNVPGIALGILTADCVPVLFADAEARVIGAAHAGWKGALTGVIENTLSAMMARGAKLPSIHVAIGPAIAQASYEVGEEFYQRFCAADTAYEDFFALGNRPLHYQFDIKGFVRARLENARIAAINMLENDTCMEEDRFYSFRRATHRGEPDYGRQISAITLHP